MQEKTLTHAGHPTTKTATPSRRLADLHCDSMGYEFGVGVDKFELQKFSKLFESRFKEPLKPGLTFEAVLSTGDPKITDYHVHLNWWLTKSQVKVRVLYVQKANKAEEDEKEPFAEGAMKWLGVFFKAKDAPAHIHTAFEYPVERWRPAIPLPIKIPVGGNPEVEVDGMSFNLGKNETGMGQAWLISREKVTRVLLYGDRPVEFLTFDIIREAALLSEFAKNFIKETPNETDKF
jgi:hypothetical protein